MSDQAVDHRAEASWLAVAHRISKGSYPSEAKGPALIAIAHALLAGPPEKSMQPVGTAVRHVTERDS